VGGEDILIELETIAPVKAVRGNTDPVGDPRLGASIDVEIGGLRVHVSHGHERWRADAAEATRGYPRMSSSMATPTNNSSFRRVGGSW
jgi:predicted phosphodiesterase